MIVFVAIFALLPFIKIKIQKDKENFLDRKTTLSVCGFFALLIFLSHFFSYINTNNLPFLDKTAFVIVNAIGQLMVAPFLFFSGYGIFESFKKNGKNYILSLPKKRISKIYFSFLLVWFFYIAFALWKDIDYSLPHYVLSAFGITSIGNSNWYVVVILLLYFSSFLSSFLSTSKKSFLIANWILIIFLYLFFKGTRAPLYWYNTLLSYGLGMSFSYYKEKVCAFLNKKKILPFLMMLLSIGLFISFYYLSNHTNVLSGLFYYFTISFFCFSIVLFLYYFRIYNRILLFFGKYAFWIYMIQRLPMIALSTLNGIFSNKYFLFVICFLITIFLSVVLGKVFLYFWNIFVINKIQASENSNIKVGIAISYLALGISVVGAFVVTPKILNILGDGQYGLYSFAISITSWLTVISGALSTSYLKFANMPTSDCDWNNKTNTVYFKLFAIISAVALLIVFFAIGIFYFFKLRLPNYSEHDNNIILLLVLISSINLAINIIGSVFTNYCSYKKEFIFIRSLSLFISVLNYALELVFVFLTKSVVSISLVSLFLMIIQVTSTIIYARRFKRMGFANEKISSNKSFIRSILVFSSFVLINAIVDQINNHVDITILGIMVNSETVTTYTLSRYFISYLLTISVAISSTFAPTVHELVKNNDEAKLNALFNKVSKSQMILMFLIVGGYLSCGREFIRLWLGDGRSEVYEYSAVLLSLNIIPLSCNLGIEIQRAKNKHKFRAVLYIVLAVLNVALSILLIHILPKEYAIWGAIIGTVVSVVFGNVVILNIYNHKVIKINMITYFFNVFKFAIIAACSFAASYGIGLLTNRINSIVLAMIIKGLMFVFVFSLISFVVFPRDFKNIVKNIYGKIKKAFQ